MLRSVHLVPTPMPLQSQTPVSPTVPNALRVTLVTVSRLLLRRPPAPVATGATPRMKILEVLESTLAPLDTKVLL